MFQSTLKYNQKIWDQLKKVTPKILIRALEKCGWIRNEEMGYSKGAVMVYVKGLKTVNIHYHPSKSGFGKRLLKKTFNKMCLTEDELKKKKLIRK